MVRLLGFTHLLPPQTEPTVALRSVAGNTPSVFGEAYDKDWRVQSARPVPSAKIRRAREPRFRKALGVRMRSLRGALWRQWLRLSRPKVSLMPRRCARPPYRN